MTAPLREGGECAGRPGRSDFAFPPGRRRPVTLGWRSVSKSLKARLREAGARENDHSHRTGSHTMDSATATVVVPAPKPEVFDYLSRIENVPEWADEFVQEFSVQGPGEARAVTEMGDVTFRIEADGETGVIDMFSGPDEDRMALFPTRVVPLGDDRSAFIFTMFRGPDQTDEEFEAGLRSLERELENVVRRFSGGSAGTRGDGGRG